ncbi:MAG: DUF4261 domain-containing protein [Micromonosporaceae bacterium]|nr:DUF4261 domain-containing protein [Micromonosporaceae bacterium]
MAELLFETGPRLDPEALLARVHQAMPETTLAPPDKDAWLFAHLALPYTYAGGESAPLQTALLFASSDPATEVRDLSQSWEWPDAQATLAACPHSILVTEMLGRVHEPADRLRAFRAVLDAAVELARPTATWWPVSGQALPPDGLADHPLRGLLNVRLFRVENDPGVSLMDTLGMAPFELPDLQCHFRDLNPGQVGALLFNTAVYLVEKGPVIDSGHTIAGVSQDQVWRAQWEDSLAQPTRVVIDLDPGDPYAAGGRHR